MRAAVLTRYGDVDALEVRDVPEPRVGPGKLKVRIAASSLNAIDWKIRSGALRSWFPLELPAILGFDAAGEVVELGPGVSGFRVGDRVLGQIRHGQAELALATSEQIAKVPQGLSLIDAAAIPVVALTGTQLLEEAVDIALCLRDILARPVVISPLHPERFRQLVGPAPAGESDHEQEERPVRAVIECHGCVPLPLPASLVAPLPWPRIVRYCSAIPRHGGVVGESA